MILLGFSLVVLVLESNNHKCDWGLSAQLRAETDRDGLKTVVDYVYEDDGKYKVIYLSLLLH